MSPGNRAGSVSEISHRQFFLCKNIDVFTDKRGRSGPVTEISVFTTEIWLTGMKNFPYEHYSPLTGTKLLKQDSFALTT